MGKLSGLRRKLRTAKLSRIAGAGAAAIGLSVIAMPSPASGDPSRDSESNVIDGSYIVVYEDGTSSAGARTAAYETSMGFESEHTYRSALKGFAAELTQGQVDALESESAVDYVAQDRMMEASALVPRVAGEPSAPTGIRRIKSGVAGKVREASAVRVAVIDSGVSTSHPDLNQSSGIDCVNPGTTSTDENGHGSHVAGTIGALNNGAGVTGVAPGTKILGVRVLNASGNGSFAQIICGIDWVTANKAAKNIEVANMSLGGLGSPVQPCATTTDPMHDAICNSTDAGVTYVVAAGNDGWDFDFASNPNVPAAYPNVLTVTAITDSNGNGGAPGSPPACDPSQSDETPADFSNFANTAAGAAHTIAAPGTCIRSTWKGTVYQTISGTSMASPHVAGVAALCHQEVGHQPGPCMTRTPQQNISYLRNTSESYNVANPSHGFTCDASEPPCFSNAFYGWMIFTRPSTPEL
ncbi:MAG TPA: S8 family serine peptidase [Solirubrobacterales bacterium]|nr:S8 family serine peptidase [Solirubrobacterales bacterium]